MKIASVVALVITLIPLYGQHPEMDYEDKIRIREAITIAADYGEQIWKDMKDVPFVILLVTEETEFLINHPNPSEDFEKAGMDEVLKTNIYYRPQQFNKHFKATFPAVNGVNTIVMGTPENTDLNTTEWIIILLHEHFHQYQFSSPGYFANLDSLDLSGGDDTGMWQLNYPFAYEDPDLINAFREYSVVIERAVKAIGQPSWSTAYQTYLEQRSILKELMQENDYKYFSFQLYQEGIARYTEGKYLDLLQNYVPSKEVVSISDFISFCLLRGQFYKQQSQNLKKIDLAVDKRISFYDIGWAEGMLLDQVNPKWRQQYLKDKFFLEAFSF